MYSDLTDESSDFFSGILDLAEEEKDEIKEEYDTRIHEEICSSLESEELSQHIEWIRENSENEQSRSDTKKYQKMQSIEPFSSRDIECYEKYDESWYDEKNLKEIHKESDQLSGGSSQ